MTNRTLSPAAQAVLDAYESVPYYPNENDEGMLAAALRAAADCLGYELLGVRVVDCSQLLNIATELETQ
jgi:hypothetical protein